MSSLLSSITYLWEHSRQTFISQGPRMTGMSLSLTLSLTVRDNNQMPVIPLARLWPVASQPAVAQSDVPVTLRMFLTRMLLAATEVTHDAPLYISMFNLDKHPATDLSVVILDVLAS